MRGPDSGRCNNQMQPTNGLLFCVLPAPTPNSSKSIMTGPDSGATISYDSTAVFAGKLGAAVVKCVSYAVSQLRRREKGFNSQIAVETAVVDCKRGRLL